MNRIPRVLLLSILAVFLTLSSEKLLAQYKYSFSFGESHERIHSSYGNHLRFYYNFTDHFNAYVEGTRFYKIVEKENNQNISYLTRQINLNFTYSMHVGDHLRIFPIIGADYTYESSILTDNGLETNSIKETTGFNFGLGIAYQIGRFNPYFETISTVTTNSFFLYSIGIRYSFGKR